MHGPGSRLRWMLGTAALVAAACGPRPTRSLVDFDTPTGIVYGVSTEEGILVLSDILEETTEELPFRYYVPDGMFDDVAKVELRGDSLAILHAVSSRPDEARLAAEPPRAGETLYVETRDREGTAVLEEVALHRDGAGGNLIDVEGNVENFARYHAGTPLLAYRDGFCQIVGILNGVYSPGSRVVAFIGVEELTRLFLRPGEFLLRETLPKRADFEYGIPRDFAGERVYATGAGPLPEPLPVPPDALEPVAPAIEPPPPPAVEEPPSPDG